MGNEKKALDRQAILSADDRPIVSVDVPEWGGAVNVRALSGTQRGQIEQLGFEIREGNETVSDLYVQLCIWSVVDDQGAPLFTDEDRNVLSEKAGSALEKIGGRAMEISGLSADAVEAEAKN